MCIHKTTDNTTFPSYGTKMNQKPTQQPSQDTAGNRLTDAKRLSCLPKVAYFSLELTLDKNISFTDLLQRQNCDLRAALFWESSGVPNSHRISDAQVISRERL